MSVLPGDQQLNADITMRLRQRIDDLTDQRDQARAEALRAQKILAGHVKNKQVRAVLMRDMRDRGWSYEKIARALGVHHTTVIYWCSPEARERRHERYRRQRATA